MASIQSPKTKTPEALVRAMYRKLARAWGRQHWWPAATPFEVIVGAILTQNTSWKNVERAMASLRSAGALSLKGIRETPLERLEGLVRSSGYYRQKAARLKNFVAFADMRYGGSLRRIFATSTAELRLELLAQNGIGHETADAILLYAGHHEVFVVDAYARRILERHEVVGRRDKYDDIRTLMERALGREAPLHRRRDDLPLPPGLQIHSPSSMSKAERTARAQVFNEMHGLLVQVGKHYCLKEEPQCQVCPLRSLLPHGTTLLYSVRGGRK